MLSLTKLAAISGLPLILSTAALGQATLYMSPVGTDITPDGNILTGALYDATADQYWAHVFNRATGAHTYYTDRPVEGGLYCNHDATVLAAEMNDLEDLAGFGTNRTLAHARTGAGPWVNLGMAPGGYRCDFNVNSPYGVARSTNEILINGWSASLCGPFRTWLYNTTTQSFTQLPFSVSPPPINQASFGTRANRVSDNGDAACGWDDNWNSNFTSHFRKATAWKKVGGVWNRYTLDSNGGEGMAVSGDGNVIVGYMSPTTMQSTFGTSTQYAVRWTWNGNSWNPQNLGGSSNSRAYWISSDGGTVVGDFFIWRANLNGGVAMNLGSFLSSIGLDMHGMEIGGPGGAVTQGFSGDGNSLIVQITDHRDPCLTVFKRGVIDFNGRPCSAPVEIFPPSSLLVEGEIGLPANHYYGVILNMFAAGTADLSYQWQRQIAGDWVDLNDDNCGQYDPHFFDVLGSHGSQLRLGQASGVGSFAGNYRCVVTNGCGVLTSSTAVITTSSACPADFNGDGFLDFFDIDAFVAAFESGDPQADFNGDGFLDFFDADAYVGAFEAGC